MYYDVVQERVCTVLRYERLDKEKDLARGLVGKSAANTHSREDLGVT